MGTPEFAVAPLRALVEGGYRVVAVVTMPDKPIGRGLKVQASPVKQYALSQQIPVLQPERLKDESFVAELRAFRAHLQVVVAFRMLPEVVWNMPPMGTFNLHASLLPQYRGAAPIQWAVMNGDAQTGVTTFLLKQEIDTGNILLQESLDVAPDEDGGSVHDRLMALGASMVPRTVDLLLSGDFRAVPQDELTHEALRPAPKLFKDNTRLDWNRPANTLYNMVRGLSPYPCAWTEFEVRVAAANGAVRSERITFKIQETAAEIRTGVPEVPGTVLTDGRRYMKVAVADGYLWIKKLQPAGKKPMAVEDYLRGFQSAPGFQS